MAQAQPEEKIQDSTQEKYMKETKDTAAFKFNAHAPEFVPRSHCTQMPVSGYFYPCFNFLGGTGTGSEWFIVGDQEPAYLISNTNVAPPDRSKNILTDDLKQKIIKQVEYQLSNMSLIANESLVKHVNKDPEGYVPISVIASAKKIKSLVSNNPNPVLAQALRSSSRLVVSDDGKKVRRKDPFTEKEKEELQARIVVAENLPEDHSHQNLEKIFGVVGSVKSIRICHPQEPNSSRSKSDFLVSNKLHALVEYESTEIAEKAVEKLNDERNWRKGFRVRLLLRRSPKSVLKNRKTEFDGILDEDETPESPGDSCQPNNIESVLESNAEENAVGSKKLGWGRGRGKSRGRGQSCHSGGRGVHAPSPQSNSVIQAETSAKQAASKGPRMPDGTKGFTIGRGKPLTTPATAASP
ncbi:la-related protein 6C [Carya illinoinensis]|uniref:La-related protein 6C n=1 Tax=Carya illinoinensis TaxID=32201 RepID=A0A8T1QEU9_CARIL|nr:la-related protein 6C [Carya illinoinensis]KAG6653150.1 hypothetical protein CIPAW_05G055100 [Carya illinoinensis]KAG6711473.1 hypothetical protein I3842_05G055400 [Carya illinoinensis]